MAPSWRTGVERVHGASGVPEALAWWRALLASHGVRSLLAMLVVVAAIAAFAALA